MEFDSDGVRIHYELNGPQGGTPVVMVHGFASDYRLNWVGSRWQETFTQAGFRAIGMDCRGHGDSGKPHDVAAYSDCWTISEKTRLRTSVTRWDRGSASKWCSSIPSASPEPFWAASGRPA